MRRGLTLIEVLGVIVIVALVASVTTVGLAATHERSRLRDTAAQMRDLDGRARLLAATVGTVVVSMADDGRRVELRAGGVERDELLASLEIPINVTIEVDTDPVIFDRLGRSPDYTVTLEAGQYVERWQVAGLTGHVTERKP